MERFMELFHNIPLIAGMIGWFGAEIVKIVINCIRGRTVKYITWKGLFASGGMPSSHAASMCALSAAIAFAPNGGGFGSPAFAVSVLVSAIVMYDASGVRKEAGEQAKALNLIMRDVFSTNPEYSNRAFKELIGHTKAQVFVGAVFGIAVGVLCGLFLPL